MTTVSMKEAKNRLTELARAAEKGETIVLTRNGKAVCDLVPHKERAKGINWDAGEKFLRERGVTKLFTYIAPDFDHPLPEDFLISPLPESKPSRPRARASRRKK